MYFLPSTILRSTKHKTLDAAYLYYYATDVAFAAGAEEDGRLTARLRTLISDALVVAAQARMDVFNAQTLMDNVPILKDLQVRVVKFILISSRDVFFFSFLRDLDLDSRTAVWPRGRVPQLLLVQLADRETCGDGG